jgi:hypothetical protein
MTLKDLLDHLHYRWMVVRHKNMKDPLSLVIFSDCDGTVWERDIEEL